MLNDDITPGSESLTNWQEKVLNSITREGNQDPNTQGPAIDWDLFNQEGDNTQIFLMTPLKDGATESSNQFKYPNKVGLITSLLTANGRIPGARVIIKGYNRLNYSVVNGQVEGPDANQVDKTERGIALFQ
jgi:hypothetical protein